MKKGAKHNVIATGVWNHSKPTYQFEILKGDTETAGYWASGRHEADLLDVGGIT